MHRLDGRAVRSCRLPASSFPIFCSRHSFRHSWKGFATSNHYHESNQSPPPKVTWYQQLFPGARGRQHLDPKIGEADESSILDQLRGRIAQLERELGDRSEDGQQNSTSQTSLIEPLLDQLSEEDRGKVRRALQQTELNDEENAEIEAESEVLTRRALGGLAGGFGTEILRQIDLDELDMVLELGPQQIAHLRRFNTSLKIAAGNYSDNNARKSLWVSYERCKRLIPCFTQHVPNKCWDILWKSQYEMPSEDRDRTTHLKTLAQDIAQSSSKLSAEQRESIVNCLIDEGRLEEAQEEWEMQQSPSGAATAKKHGLQGVRIFALQGQLERAHKIAENISQDADCHTARCLITIIEAWAKSKDGDNIRRAWDAYIDLRSKLGTNIEIDDFDKVTMCFINAGRTDVALAVFKDMMLTGRVSGQSPNELYKTSLSVIGTMQAKSASLAEISSVSLSALTALPREFQNKFFYGSWIKKLIGMGEVDAAVSVVELMYERGVTPDAKHVNGIIGAWLRSGHSIEKKRGEQLGCAMIQQRLRFVKARREGRRFPSSCEETQPKSRSPAHVQRNVPAATIETFSLLLLYYERRSKATAISELKENLEMAEIPPNSFFMNHLLYAELRRGQHSTAWKTYQEMKSSVKPDLETFACLWDCEKAHLVRLSISSDDGFPGPRTIFHGFFKWYRGLSERNRVAVRQEFSEDVYNQILRCMCLAKDLEGTLVALYALKQWFHFLPNDETLRLIPMQVARIGLERTPVTPRRRRSRLSDRAGHKTKVADVERVLDLVVERRLEALEQQGVNLEECSVERQNEEKVHMLAGFLRLVMQRMGRDVQAASSAIDAAAEEMGVRDLNLQQSLLVNELLD
ncbi:MAG: hypothetical protein Q9183_001812 [Haloplaca sp. 2 TL-2023]